MTRAEILIVGGGLAGLFLALKLAPRRTLLIAGAPIGGAAASAWAQGGLAAALSPQDHPDLHARDTIAAGAGLTDPAIARLLAEDGPGRVSDLIRMGVAFDRDESGALALSLEAAHSTPRVARVSGDRAGAEIMAALSRRMAAAPHLAIAEGMRARALVRDSAGRVCGVRAIDDRGERHTLTASAVVLASGGSGGLFSVTTNPPSALADGLSMAYEAGAVVADPEFTQFHPTAMDIGCDPAPLATEALRGEGARLINAEGRAFMPGYHPLADLAPRDIVARAVHLELAAGRGAFLDCRSLGDYFVRHFSAAAAACATAGINPLERPIPIAPAMHYHMGGVVTDAWGQTSVDGLWACGETASTGAHGANRLASNSLLEAVVFADRIAARLLSITMPAPQTLQEPDTPPEIGGKDLHDLRVLMRRSCGVIRSEQGLSAALAFVRDRQGEAGRSLPLVAADIIITAALARQESRGAHYRSDFPAPEPVAKRTFIRRGADGLPSLTFHPAPDTTVTP
jgi:L-aspartate oxidase